MYVFILIPPYVPSVREGTDEIAGNGTAGNDTSAPFVLMVQQLVGLRAFTTTVLQYSAVPLRGFLRRTVLLYCLLY